MVAHAYPPSTWKAESGKFHANLDHGMSGDMKANSLNRKKRQAMVRNEVTLK